MSSCCRKSRAKESAQYCMAINTHTHCKMVEYLPRHQGPGMVSTEGPGVGMFIKMVEYLPRHQGPGMVR
jgi:hypothetical protein